MERRSPPQKRIDDHAFPVRVKVLVPERGFENLLLDMRHWLERGNRNPSRANSRCWSVFRRGRGRAGQGRHAGLRRCSPARLRADG